MTKIHAKYWYSEREKLTRRCRSFPSWQNTRSALLYSKALLGADYASGKDPFHRSRFAARLCERIASRRRSVKPARRGWPLLSDQSGLQWPPHRKNAPAGFGARGHSRAARGWGGQSVRPGGAGDCTSGFAQQNGKRELAKRPGRFCPPERTAGRNRPRKPRP